MIKIDKASNRIVLKTKNTTYAMEMLYGKFPVHLYYGKTSPKADMSYKCPIHSFSPYHQEHGLAYLPDIAQVEFPFFGYGDFRATALRLLDLGTGSDVTDFTFRRAKKKIGRVDIPGMPYGDADEKTETLELLLTDDVTGCELYLYYTLFPECDTISRYFKLVNKGQNNIRIQKCMSLSLDLPSANLDLIDLGGKYGRERRVERVPLGHNICRISSKRGASSHHHNPFIMLADHNATEERGDAYAFNLVYSGSFLDEIEVDQNNTTRVMLGLGDESFNYLLCPGEEFISPEAVMTYSANGIGQASRNMHQFVRRHILPPTPFEKRPVVLNSWEAFYFKIDGKLMVDFAKGAHECGMDMLVMDDGWFGARNDDHAGLGDWTPNLTKFPQGLPAFVKEVKQQGVHFGIWIEPEMVNKNSDLYRAHSDWCIRAPGREPLLSRDQLVLDMANPAVLQYLKDSFTTCFRGVDIDYFKWDMNRHMSNVYSPYLPPERQGEAAYRYMLGVYELFRWLRELYPNAMIENCSGGGGRYDLGMMKYSTQIWTSDTTDPIQRTYIQYGSSFGYPTTVMSCHVANHGNSCEDPRKLNYGFRVALNGPLGYEFNVLSVSETAKAAMREQVKEYRLYENLILNGDFYRLVDPFACDCYAYYVVSEDNSEILLSFLQNYDDPKEKSYKLKVSRAKRGMTYRDTISGDTFTGDELRKGITVQAQKKGLYAKMLHLVTEN
ncbi:MAG: alpha-galactosidase [Clostridia bacterium]|nr:alpha-galactosidase [Clostridia bacterium]